MNNHRGEREKRRERKRCAEKSYIVRKLVDKQTDGDKYSWLQGSILHVVSVDSRDARGVGWTMKIVSRPVPPSAPPNFILVLLIK